LANVFLHPDGYARRVRKVRHVFPVERAHESRSRLATVVLAGIVFASAAAAPHDEAFAISLNVATTADTFGLHGDGKLIDWLSVVITQ
jgi:hypothetical protein